MERKQNNKKHESSHRGNEYIILITRALGIGARLLNPRGYLFDRLQSIYFWCDPPPTRINHWCSQSACALVPRILDNTCVRAWNCLLSEQPLTCQGLASILLAFLSLVPLSLSARTYVVTPIGMFLVTRQHGCTSLLIVGLKVMTHLIMLAH